MNCGTILYKAFNGKYVKVKETGKIILVNEIARSADFFGGYVLCGVNPFTNTRESYSLGLTILFSNNVHDFMVDARERFQIVEKPKILDTEIFKALTEGN